MPAKNGNPWEVKSNPIGWGESAGPIVWGGAPAIFDMRQGTTPMGAIETAMIDIAYAQIGKYLGLPTHPYLSASDSKLVDAQAGMESGMSALSGAWGGINMISGAGMLDFLACQSPEKLVIDAEGIGMVKRFLKGIERHTASLALYWFHDFDFQANFLKQNIERLMDAEIHAVLVGESLMRETDVGKKWSELLGKE